MTRRCGRFCAKSFETDGAAAVIRWAISRRTPGEGPLFITAEVRQEEALRDRTFYWFNYKDQSGCLFDRPRTGAARRCEGGGAHC